MYKNNLKYENKQYFSHFTQTYSNNEITNENEINEYKSLLPYTVEQLLQLWSRIPTIFTIKFTNLSDKTVGSGLSTNYTCIGFVQK